MARQRVVITQEERERIRREAAEANRGMRLAAERAVTATARAWLAEQGLLVAGEGVGRGLARMYRYRSALQASARQAYRPTVRQQMAAPLLGIDVEVEF